MWCLMNCLIASSFSLLLLGYRNREASLGSSLSCFRHSLLIIIVQHYAVASTLSLTTATLLRKCKTLMPGVGRKRWGNNPPYLKVRRLAILV